MPSAPSPDPRCPVCGAPSSPEHRPFCGQGCRDRDLLQWLSDGHRIPGPPAKADPESEAVGLDSRSAPRL